MNAQLIALLLLLAFLALPAPAQSNKVLQGREITESALIDALTPDKVRTRTFEHDDAAGERAKSGKASLLITFVTNSATLTARAKHSVDVVGHALNDENLAGYQFAIEGHADPRGKPERNQTLSEERAESVRQYLVRNHNISEERLVAVGKGDKEPLNAKNPAAPENRRVTIVTLTK